MRGVPDTSRGWRPDPRAGFQPPHDVGRHNHVAGDVEGSVGSGITAPSTLAYAQVEQDQNTISSEVELTGLSVTVNVAAGRRIRVSCGVRFDSSTTLQAIVIIKEDGNNLRILRHEYPAADQQTMDGFVVLTPTAGLHTYKLTAQTTTGTINLNAAPTDPSFILVEDITGVAIPAPPASVPVGMIGISSGSQTTIAGIGSTAVDLGYNANVVVPEGRVLKITGRLRVVPTTANEVWRVRIKNNGVDVGVFDENISRSGWGLSYITVHAVDTPSAGSHTYTMTLERDVGSGTATFQVLSSNFLLVEDITPTPAPTNQLPSSTLGYAEVSSSISGLGNNVDLPGLSVEINASTGRRLKVTGYALVSNDTAGQTTVLRIMQDGVEIQKSVMGDSIANGEQEHSPVAIVTPSAGLHTYNLQYNDSGGTGAVEASSTHPAFILVEDITGVSTALDIPTGLWAPANEFPSNPGHGDLFYETDTDKLWAWNGSDWVQLIASGSWENYTPININITIGDGDQGARWTRMGQTAIVRYGLTFGSTTAFTGTAQVGMPVPAQTGTGFNAAFRAFGAAHYLETGNRNFEGDVRVSTAFAFHEGSASNGNVDATHPFIWGPGDLLGFTVAYEILAGS